MSQKQVPLAADTFVFLLIFWGKKTENPVATPNDPTLIVFVTMPLTLVSTDDSCSILQVNSKDTIVKDSKYDAASGCFTVPAKTTAVFVEPRKT